MNLKAMMRQFRGHVILGLPKSPLSYLGKFRLKYGTRPHIFVNRCPLWLRLLPLANVHISAARSHAEILLLELSDLAAENSEKLMTLTPATPEALHFILSNRQHLEPLYMLNTDCQNHGGTP